MSDIIFFSILCVYEYIYENRQCIKFTFNNDIMNKLSTELKIYLLYIKCPIKYKLCRIIIIVTAMEIVTLYNITLIIGQTISGYMTDFNWF